MYVEGIFENYIELDEYIEDSELDRDNIDLEELVDDIDMDWEFDKAMEVLRPGFKD